MSAGLVFGVSLRRTRLLIVHLFVGGPGDQSGGRRLGIYSLVS